jgi:hypothetical protein
MFKKIKIITILGLIISPCFAQYTINKHSINNGGDKISGGSYTLSSSIGQHDASDILSQNNYTLTGGFWQQKDTAPLLELIFSNGFE